jgi:transposase InsO family protein
MADDDLRRAGTYSGDNGPARDEFGRVESSAKRVRDRLHKVGVKTLFIEPGNPSENGHVESFNGKLTKELFERGIFHSLQEVNVLIEMERMQHNTVRRHSSPP